MYKNIVQIVFNTKSRLNKMSKYQVEIRASEGGAESKLLVKDQFAIYAKACTLECL